MSGPAPLVLLLGMMGAGKTTVGRRLAGRTGWPYVDNDELVREAAGMDTADVLDRHGAASLRRFEAAALEAALEREPPVVAGVAGGVVEDAALRTRLRSADAVVVYLRARLETLAERVRSDPPRPWLDEDPGRALERLWEGRAAAYEEVADLVIDVDDRTPDEVADLVVGAVTTA